MVLNRFKRFCGFSLALAIWAVSTGRCAAADSVDPQSGTPRDPQAVIDKISAAYTKLEMTVNGSRILSMDQPIPKAQVANPEILDFTVLSENQVQIHAKKAGITTVNLWDDKEDIHTVDVVISGDVRELDRLLRVQYPTASLKLFPTSASTLIIFGYVDRPDYVNRIMRIAEDYYPKVLNNMVVGGSQQVLLHVKVMEVSRTNLKILGVDWVGFLNENFLASNVSGIITKASPTASIFRSAGSFTSSARETMQFGVVSGENGFVGFLEALKQENLLKVLAEPNLVTVSGRPASYLVGGQMPYPMPTGFGNIAIQFRDFGTQIDFVPIVLGNGSVRLEVRPKVSEIDPTLGIVVAGTAVPGFRVREVDTGVELKFGQTLAIAGLLQQRTTVEKKGVPYLMDVPYLGAAFSRKSNQINEVELLILVRPELVEALDPEQVPPCGPGLSSMSPADCDLYWKGYTEVPVRMPGMMGHGIMAPQREPVPSPQTAPAIEEMPTTKVRSNEGPVAGVATPQGPRMAAVAARRAEGAPVQAAPVPMAPVRTPPVASVTAPSASATASPMNAEPITAAPLATARVPAASYNPPTSQPRQTRPQTNPKSQPPGFIGPRGYDVKD